MIRYIFRRSSIGSSAPAAMKRLYTSCRRYSGSRHHLRPHGGICERSAPAHLGSSLRTSSVPRFDDDRLQQCASATTSDVSPFAMSTTRDSSKGLKLTELTSSSP